MCVCSAFSGLLQTCSCMQSFKCLAQVLYVDGYAMQCAQYVIASACVCLCVCHPEFGHNEYVLPVPANERFIKILFDHHSSSKFSRRAHAQTLPSIHMPEIISILIFIVLRTWTRTHTHTHTHAKRPAYPELHSIDLKYDDGKN